MTEKIGKRTRRVGEQDFRFPPDTMAMVRRLAKYLDISEAKAISKGIGLLEIWIQAQRKKRLIVERSKSGKGKEQVIVVKTR